MEIQISDGYKRMTAKAIFAIIIFIITYLLVLSFSVGLVVLCGMFELFLLFDEPFFITIILGFALFAFSIFIIIFLLKFLFKIHKVDRSALIEITHEQEPELFRFIHEIVEEVGTEFPKKVYLSSDVNASVFYDSNFWSMFFPLRKNLNIGMGLVNTISKQEFKGILAHEFGHFSQRSIKLGSFVYNVNYVIYNMLDDDDAYSRAIKNSVGTNGTMVVFFVIAFKIIEGIQWIFKKIYGLVNKSYMALSREMEFHADQVAANVAGSIPLTESLLRMDYANYSFDYVLNFYESKIEKNLKSKNIFKDQFFVMNYLAKDNDLTFRNGLPLVSESDLGKYNKSKLNIKDQWASHPQTEDRVEALKNLNIVKDQTDDRLARVLFSDALQTEEMITQKIFSKVVYQEVASEMEEESFREQFLENMKANNFSKKYNGYYDNKNLIEFDIENVQNFEVDESIETLFSKENLDLVYTYVALENDKMILSAISKKEIQIKTFDYDGKKYRSKDAEKVVERVEKEINSSKIQIADNDLKIYKYFYNSAKKCGKEVELKNLYINFFAFDKDFDSKIEFYNDLVSATSFVNVETPYEKIRQNMKRLATLEKRLKEEIKLLLSDESLANEISVTTRANFENYLAKDMIYFSHDVYKADNLKVLFAAIGDFQYLISRTYFFTKYHLLEFQMDLV